MDTSFGFTSIPVAPVVGGGFRASDVDVHLLAKQGENELLSDYLNVMERWSAFMERSKEREIGELTKKVDDLVLAFREKESLMQRKRQEYAEAASNHDQAQRLTAHYSTQFHSLKHEVENSRALLTTLERMQRKSRLNELADAYQRAQLAESHCVTLVRESKFAWDAALAETKQADALAREAQEKLARLKGEIPVGTSSIRYSTTTGFQV